MLALLAAILQDAKRIQLPILDLYAGCQQALGTFPPMKDEEDHAAGSLASCGEVDFLTAMTRLKLMGWSTCLVEEMEESNSSGNSSPDRVSFGHHQLDKTFSPSISNRMQSIDGSLLPSAQCANLLAGSGLDFAPVSAHHLLAFDIY